VKDLKLPVTGWNPCNDSHELRFNYREFQLRPRILRSFAVLRLSAFGCEGFGGSG